MTQLKLSRVAAALTPVLAGMTLAFNVQAANETQSTVTAPGAQHGQSAEAQQQMQDVRASELIGTAVEGSDGKRLGDIEDLVIDLNSQRVHYAVLGHGGIAGIGEKLFAYPVSALQPGQEGRLRLNVSAEKLKDAPGFDRQHWPKWGKDDYQARVDRYYGEATPVKPDEDPRYVRASDFIGKDIKDRSNQDVGEIEDVIVNMKDGSLHYLLVEFDDWHENNAGRLFAVAPNGLRADPEDKDDLKLDVDRQTLASAPGIEIKRLRDKRDQSWIAQMKRDLDSSPPMRGAVGATPSSDAATATSPGGRAQTERLQQGPEPMHPGGGQRATGTPADLPQPVDTQ
ncbi:MAG TPA: PRC-barrel domain-containing protein [Burkholderiales bacterium]|nr:PRC-barrel domain-containing protein [Burkholderiales bacterium]